MPDDATLLRLYAEERSEEAFAELVRRHVGLVYFTALRKVQGDSHLAQDVSQKVFADLARKAGPLSRRTMIAGWLYVGTHHAAAQLLRSERRRREREQEAYQMNESSNPPTAEIDSEQVHPVLDEVIRKLSDTDREAVLLRFFEQRPFTEIGAALELTEEAARKRVERALEKLRAGLAHRGITSTANALSLVLVSKCAVAVPVGLAAQVSVNALATAAAGGKVLSSLPLFSASSVKAGCVGLAVFAGATVIVLPFYPSLLGSMWSAGAPAAPATPAVPAAAARRAIVIIGLTADSVQAGRLQAVAGTLRRGFLARGISDHEVEIIGGSEGAATTREAVLDAIRGGGAAIKETWIVLLGHSAVGRDGRPSYQVRGPRLSAEDFAAAVGGIPGRKYVVVATSLSGGFLPALQALPEIEAVAATADRGEINEPHFGPAWAETLAAQPRASFADLAAGAAGRVEGFYRQNALVPGEHARIVDRGGARIVELRGDSKAP